MKLRILLLLTLITSVSLLQAQNRQDRDPNLNNDLYLIPEIRIGYSFLDTNNPLVVSGATSNPYKTQYGNYTPLNYSALISAGYHFTPQYAAGIGVGIVRYTQPGATSLPLFIDLRGYFKDAKETPFAFAKLGTCFQWWKTFEPGTFATLGLGYKFFWGKQCMTASLGYEFKHNSNWTDLKAPENTSVYSLNRHSFCLSIGMILF